MYSNNVVGSKQEVKHVVITPEAKLLANAFNKGTNVALIQPKRIDHIFSPKEHEQS